MGQNCILRVQFHPPQNSAKVYPNDTCSPSRTNKTRRARHASHGDPTIYDQKKNILKGKDELSKVNSRCKNLLFKNSSKRKQNPSSHYNSTINLKFQRKPKSPLRKIFTWRQTWYHPWTRTAQVMYLGTNPRYMSFPLHYIQLFTTYQNVAIDTIL